MPTTTLMDTLKSKLSGAPTPQMQTGVQDDTQRTQNLLRTKLGKATTNSAAPRISNLQEQQSAATADAGLKQTQLQGTLRAEQLGQQEDQIKSNTQEQMLDIKSKIADMEDAFMRRSSEIIEELGRADKTLTEDRKTAKLEQLGFMLRLQDKDYLTNLERAGREARLNNELSFKEQLSKEIFDDDIAAFKDELSFKEFINANQRQFEEMLGAMDLSTAERIAQQGINDAKSQAIWSGGAQAASGAIQYGSTRPSSQAPQTNSESMTGGDTYDYSTTV